ncbi:IclR family transcriptional regulator [Nocardia brevicatena]|uniref:IclR family transcriptional regulator n=1 Tax=Nocardia brevicatena TaxID=37327 RepID=UPI0003153957|nr:IclR family transcriptional regulator [Nocardia brevicatena]
MPERQLDERSVLGRALLILEAFGVEDRALGLSELARRTGLPKATVHRMSRDLVAARLLGSSPEGYRLGRGLFELGMRAATERTLLEVAVPFLQDLFTRTRETVHLGVRDGDEVVYISKIGGHRQARAPSRIGGRMPLYCTAIGKALLAHSGPDAIDRILAEPLTRRAPRTVVGPGLLRAHLTQVLEQGVAYEYEESAVGIACVAAPILSAEDEPLAAVSVTGPLIRFHPEKHASSVQAAAAGIASILARRVQTLP